VINDLVDNVYVLNLERDFFKYEILARKLNALGIKHERFLGTDGRGQGFDQGAHGTGFGPVYRSSGSVACLHSHIRIIEDAIKNKYKKILLLQDDIYFHKDFNSRVIELSSQIESSDAFYLGASEWDKGVKKYLVRERGFPQDSEYKTYKTGNRTLGLFGLILSDRTFTDILKIMKCYFFSADQSVSVVLSDPFGLGSMWTSFAAYPNLIIADTARSETWLQSSPQHARPLEIHGAKRLWALDDYDLAERYYA